jgi:general secretion pathway protein G
VERSWKRIPDFSHPRPGGKAPFPYASIGHLCCLLREEKTRASIGFTLLELIVVVAIVGTLASVAVPTYYNYVEKARITKAVVEIRQLEKEILAFQAAKERLPVSLDEIGRGDLRDPWGNLYQYLDVTTVEGVGKCRKNFMMKPLNKDFDLYSMGKDGESVSPLTAKASRDDIIRANDGQYVGIATQF